MQPSVSEACKELTKYGCKEDKGSSGCCSRKLDYHAQNIVNVVECVIEEEVVLCCS